MSVANDGKIPTIATATHAHAPAREEWKIELEKIAARHGITFEEMRSKRRFAKHVEARREAFCYLRFDRGWSTTQIGKYFNRDHSTVMFATNPQTEEQRLARCGASRASYLNAKKRKIKAYGVK